MLPETAGDTNVCPGGWGWRGRTHAFGWQSNMEIKSFTQIHLEIFLLSE